MRWDGWSSLEFGHWPSAVVGVKCLQAELRARESSMSFALLVTGLTEVETRRRERRPLPGFLLGTLKRNSRLSSPELEERTLVTLRECKCVPWL